MPVNPAVAGQCHAPALIARSSLCLVAVGGGMGTLSEMAFGLKLGKPVFCLYPEFDLPGATGLTDVNDAVEHILAWLTKEPPHALPDSEAAPLGK